MKNIDESLKRLRTDYVDLYQVHRPDISTPLRETLSALTDLVHGGKVRYIGCSNFVAWQIEKALRISEVDGLEAFVSVQPRYNILARDIERELFPLCKEEGIGVIPYSPLAGGFLTGKYKLGQPVPEGTRGQLRPDWMRQYQTEHNQTIIQELETISQEMDMKMSQLSLAWLLENPLITSPIIGASGLKQLEENVAVVNNPPPQEALVRISEVSKPDWLRLQEAREIRSRAFQVQRQKFWEQKRSL
jgi:aryl-alcohol dehydrogenase-like predicted oxidoreductase